MTVTLDIKPNKHKSPRVAVIKTTKGNPKKKNLGALPHELEEAIATFKPLLDAEEQYQLENYWHNLNFNKTQLNTEADHIERELFYFALPFHQALIQLWQLAKEQDIDFNPRKVMLTAILNKAKAVERELNEKLGEKVNILEALGIDIHRFDQQDIKKRLYTGGQALFKALTTLDRPLREVAEQFNRTAQGVYGKHVNLNPAIIQSYAAQPKRYPMWYCTVAIDLLIIYGKNPLEILPAAKVADLWVLLRRQQMGLAEASQLFFKTFAVPEQARAEVNEVLQAHYSR